MTKLILESNNDCKFNHRDIITMGKKNFKNGSTCNGKQYLHKAVPALGRNITV
jgi:hypothetical protein